MASRKRNERRFPTWEDLPDGGRRYYEVKKGKIAGYARYVKTVDADETTVSIVQEVYDDSGRLIALHQKYPVDTGHQNLPVEGEDA